MRLKLWVACVIAVCAVAASVTENYALAAALDIVFMAVVFIPWRTTGGGAGE